MLYLSSLQLTGGLWPTSTFSSFNSFPKLKVRVQTLLVEGIRKPLSIRFVALVIGVATSGYRSVTIAWKRLQARRGLRNPDMPLEFRCCHSSLSQGSLSKLGTSKLGPTKP